MRRQRPRAEAWAHVGITGSFPNDAQPRATGGLIPQSADEALNNLILLRFARYDVVPVDTSGVRPVQDRLAGQLGAVARLELARRRP
jgi:hypothetical protein